MKHTMRWFGPNDPVSLNSIRQAGCTAVVSALHQIPVGEVWTLEAINERIQLVEKDNSKYSTLTWDVVESLPVHEIIKKGLPERERLIDNYCKSLENLAQSGIKVVCYNFMPILDWSRTKLDYKLPNNAESLRFVLVDFVIFDVFILKRPNAELDYTPELISQAKVKLETLKAHEIAEIQNTVLLGLPGSLEAIPMEEFQNKLNEYKEIGKKELKENLFYFLKRIGPTLDKFDINLCVHPDDPPMSLLGLPRIVSTEQDLLEILEAYPSHRNGITFCTGSLGLRPDNNLPKMVERFADHIHFVHLRSTQTEQAPNLGLPGVFHEAAHLEGDVDMYAVVKEILKIEKNRKEIGRKDSVLPMRPDHGHLMLDDLNKSGNQKSYPGYSAIGRLKGLAELRGLELAISKVL
jgi:mannonate dehydratase